MSGFEILGAIASVVQLATSCYQLQKRIRMRSGDRELSTTIHTECGLLINEINNHILTLSADSRQSTQHLLDRLTAIKERIGKRRTRKAIFQGITVLRLYGGSDKDDLMVALQEYQSRAALLGSVAVNDVVLRISSTGGITADIQSSLLSITSGLNGLGYNMTQTEDRLRNILSEIKTVDGKMDVTMNQIAEIGNDVKRSNEAWCNVTDTIRDMIKEEGALFRESLSLRGLLNPLGRVERGDIEVNLGSMKDYLESIVQGNGWPSDLDIWECVWDVAESIHLLAPCVARRTRSQLDEQGTVRVEVSGEDYVVYFSPILGLLWEVLGMRSHFS